MEKDKYPGLPHIEPDPALQVVSWTRTSFNKITPSVIAFQSSVRRAFIQAIVTRYAISNAEELREAVTRRFGCRPSAPTIMSDMKIIGIVRVPIPGGGGSRLKLVNQLNTVNIEDELNERFRIDVLNVHRRDKDMMIEMNRGTANTMVQLINLLVDDGSRPGVIGVTTDMDKWVIIYFEGGHHCMRWYEWLKGKLY